jgi:serine/threonine protein kinase
MLILTFTFQNNILVDVSGEAVLCDFGFSRVRYEVTRTQTNIREGGRLRYLAPELSYGPDSFRTTAESDVYSLAMTLFNLSTLRVPYEELRNEMAAADAARSGQRPQKPNTTPFLAGSFDSLWELLVLMWARDDSARPPAEAVAQQLREILQSYIGASTHDDIRLSSAMKRRLSI